MKKQLILVLAIFLFIFFCSEDSNDDSDDRTAPMMPHQNSMMVPSFNSNSNLTKLLPQARVWHDFAATAVFYWTTTTNLALIVPRALFDLARSSTPSFNQEDSTWTWTVSNDSLSATLTGVHKNDSTAWEMKVTGSNFENFTWFTGISTNLGRYGSWIFNDTVGVATIQFDYDINETGDEGEIKATNINTNREEVTSYIQWEGSGSDRIFTVYNSIKDETYVIEWNKDTEAGSITVQSTGEKHCWDSRANNFQDIDCED